MGKKKNDACLSHCVFGAEVLSQHLSFLSDLLEGAKHAKDVEYIHKMRVTSRRIRSSLSLFSTCFLADDVKDWKKEIKRITTSLGAARDLDVQIQFLQAHSHSLQSGSQKKFLDFMIKHHIKKRKALQCDVVKTVVGLEDSGCIKQMRKKCNSLLVQANKAGVFVNEYETYDVAKKHVKARVNKVKKTALSLQDETQVSGHHQMRIAVKKLRYTIETFSKLYPGMLREEIKNLKRLQDLLGEIHDCDVWLDYIPNFEKKLVKKKSFDDLEEGIRCFKADIEKRRAELFSQTLTYYETLEKDDFFKKLLLFLRYPKKISSKADKKIAIIADIHGNLEALRAVFDDIRNEGVRIVLNAGDIIGYGPSPNEVIDLLSSECFLSIIGNFDNEVLACKKKKNKKADEQQQAVWLSSKSMKKSSKVFLHSLPKKLVFTIDSKKVLMVHGSPDSIDEHLYVNTPWSRFEKIALQTKKDIVIFGHTHRPFVKQNKKCLFINPGSVGRPDDGNNKASYALLDTSSFEVELRRVGYDIDEVVKKIETQHLPNDYAKMFRKGKSLKAVLNEV